MKGLKRFLASILIAALVIPAMIVLPKTAEVVQASTNGHTQAEAVSWINGKIGTAVDYDGAYGVQCVDLVKMYYQYLGQNLGSIGIAANMATVALPSGWTRDKSPRAGDIAVFPTTGSNSTGHVALVTEIVGGQFRAVDYNGTGHNDAGASRTFNTSNASAFIHPDFPSTPSYANLGDDFYATILNTKLWKPISRVDGTEKIYLKNEVGTSGQLWRFQRQSDGAYVISSCLDGKALEKTDGIGTVCTQMTAHSYWGGHYQQWFLIPQGDGYIFLSKHYTDENWVMDNYGGNSNDGNIIQINKRNNSAAQIWSVYKGSDVQLKGPSLSIASLGTSETKTRFSWSRPYGVSHYNLRIFKDKVWEGTEYSQYDIRSTNCEVILPPGNYQAYVDACNYFDYKMSNVVSFSIKEPTPQVAVEAGWYKLKTAIGDRYLDVSGDKTENGTNINIWTHVTSGGQTFYIDWNRNHSGQYMKHKTSGKYVHTETDSAGVHSSILWEDTGQDGQQWIFEDAGNGYVYIHNLFGYYLDVDNGINENGRNVIVCGFHGGANQKWKLIHAHPLIKTNATTATCISSGNREYWTCPECKEYYSDADGITKIKKDSWIIPAKGHQWDDGKVTKAATTTVTGVKAFTCAVCGKTKTETIPKLEKKTNPLKVKVSKKTYKQSKLKKAVSFSIGTTQAQGKVTYTVDKKAKKAKIKVTAKGKVLIPKKCKKGTYKITVKAAGNQNYKAGSKTVTIKVK